MATGEHATGEHARDQRATGEHEWLARRFQKHRAHLRAVAYRMLGSVSEAEDVVQEAWLRLSRADHGDVENLGGWLTTVVARVLLNMLCSRRTRSEQPLGPRVPDPIVDRADGTDPEHEALVGRWGTQPPGWRPGVAQPPVLCATSHVGPKLRRARIRNGQRAATALGRRPCSGSTRVRGTNDLPGFDDNAADRRISGAAPGRGG